jgi:hypothetical protein
MTMLFSLIIMGIILGYLIGKAMKFFSTGYGYLNDLDNKPVLIKSCRFCNTKIAKDYKKNLCPNCFKPLE